MRILQACIVTTLSWLILGCAGYYKAPSSYVHFSEYGYLPVSGKDVQISYVAYDWRVYYPETRGQRIGQVGFSPRESLPKTKEEAQAVVERNLEHAHSHTNSDLIKEIAWAPVTAPLLMLSWAPGIALITESHEHRASTNAPTAKPKPAGALPTKQSDLSPRPNTSEFRETTVHITVRTSVPAGKPVQGAAVVLLYSPVALEAYADTNGRRTFPHSTTYFFQISEQLATILARHIGAQPGPVFKLTDISGEVTYTIGVRPGEIADASVYVLVKKAGYGASAIKVPLAEIIRPEAKTATVLDKGVVPEGELNPWDVARKLEQQVVYYTKKYQGYVPQALAQFPSIPREEFERLVLHASRVAPDYPTVQAARFYYELENGRPDEAKKYHRFIKEDAIYIKQVYGMIWETGLRMRW